MGMTNERRIENIVEQIYFEILSRHFLEWQKRITGIYLLIDVQA
jgi:hypothetical protein